MVKKRKYVHDFISGKIMPEINFSINSVEVTVGTRTLRATWTPELAQDVSAFHNIDAEAELTALLSEQLVAEIDREIINDLINMPDKPYVDPIQPKKFGILTPKEVVSHNRRKRIKEETISKWENLGFLDGLNGNLIRDTYESQTRPLIAEPHNVFDGLVFPALRRVNAQLIGQDLVAVQPLRLPLGLLFDLPPMNINNMDHLISWRTNDTWTHGNLYGSRIGISIELKPHEFLPKYKSGFDLVEMPTVNRIFV